jgi:hypothetical protein
MGHDHRKHSSQAVQGATGAVLELERTEPVIANEQR